MRWQPYRRRTNNIHPQMARIFQSQTDIEVNPAGNAFGIATAVNICSASVESSGGISTTPLVVSGPPIAYDSAAVPHIRTPALASVASVLSPCLSASAEIPCRG